jgi:hypothetical protein
MDIKELIESARISYQHISDAWLIKLIASFLFAVICNIHIQLILAFTALVFVDLFTKWISLSKNYLMDYGITDVTIFDCIANLGKARSAGYIKSDIMKHRFVGKIIVYAILTFGSAIVDMTFKAIDKPEFLVAVVVGYLSISEMLSIVENLKDSGVDEAAKLQDIIEQKEKMKL